MGRIRKVRNNRNTASGGVGLDFFVKNCKKQKQTNIYKYALLFWWYCGIIISRRFKNEKR
jgi:hypothetical protein